MKKAPPRTASKKTSAARPKGYWPALAAPLAGADAAAVAASLLPLLAPKGDPEGLYAQVANAMAAQFARGTAGARRKAAKDLNADALGAAQETLAALQVQLAAAGVLRAQGKEIDAAYAALDAPLRKKFAADLSRVAQAVTRERALADVPALMGAALLGALEDAATAAKEAAKLAKEKRKAKRGVKRAGKAAPATRTAKPVPSKATAKAAPAKRHK